MSVWIEPVMLESRHVRLEPRARTQADALAEAGRNGELWRLGFTSVPKLEDVPACVDKALAEASAGRGPAFAVRRREDHRIVGCTRYGNLDSEHRRVETGWTWHAASARRSAVNCACKRLLPGHAFERLDCIAVELRTHWHTGRSRAAIEGPGAKQHGVLRQHRRMPGGSVRDAVVYSINDSEWPAVRTTSDLTLESSP